MIKTFSSSRKMILVVATVTILALFTAFIAFNNGLFSDLLAAVPMSKATKAVVVKYINAGMGVASIVALLGGGLIWFIVSQAFKHGAKKVIIAA